MTQEKQDTEKYDYREEYHIRTDRAIIALPGWRALYRDSDGGLCADSGGYFLAVVRLKRFRRLSNSPGATGWKLEMQYDPKTGRETAEETEDWRFVELAYDMACLQAVESTSSFVRMLPLGEEILEDDRSRSVR